MSSAGTPGPEPAQAAAPTTSRRKILIALIVAVVVLVAGLGVTYWYLSSRPVPNRAPVSVIRATDITPATYENVTYNASSSYDSDGDPLTYTWTMPDGSHSSAEAVNYTFTRVQSFTITLTVSDPAGSANVSHLLGDVHAAPLVIGTNTPFPPFEYYNGTQLVGFDIDLADALAIQAAYAPSWQDFLDFTTLINAVGSGANLMGASAIQSTGTIGAHYNLTMYFSTPYFVADLGVLVQTGSALSCPASGCAPADLANRTVGVLVGSQGQQLVDDHLVATNLSPSSDVQLYSSTSTAIAALSAGSVALVILESFVVQNVAASSGGSLRDAGTIHTDVAYSFAFPRTAAGKALLDRMNASLAVAMSNGTYQNLVAKWFSG